MSNAHQEAAQALASVSADPLLVALHEKITYATQPPTAETFAHLPTFVIPRLDCAPIIKLMEDEILKKADSAAKFCVSIEIAYINQWTGQGDYQKYAFHKCDTWYAFCDASKQAQELGGKFRHADDRYRHEAWRRIRHGIQVQQDSALNELFAAWRVVHPEISIRVTVDNSSAHIALKYGL